jgi:Na+-transporting NADH:ubiquinone oxidoreductase subunit A
MARTVKIRKGVDIKLEGEALKEFTTIEPSEVYALKPSDFHGVIPKLLIKEGAEVKSGTPLFYDKERENIRFASPVSGEITEIVRGEKRKILEIRILADKQIRYEESGSIDLAKISREVLIERMLAQGLWPLVIQRPFSVIARPEDTPKAVFVSAFDSAPLAPDSTFIIKGREDDFQAGIDALSKLSAGKPVQLGVRAGTKEFSNFRNTAVTEYAGKHPSGNVGVQIHHTNPINKGEVVWCSAFQDVITIGRFIRTGKADFRKVIALTGSELKERNYAEIIPGCSIKSLLKGRTIADNSRLVSGNALTGAQVEETGFFGFYDQQFTALPEGNQPKFFLTDGWLSPGLSKFSISRTFPTWLLGGRSYKLDTNLNGEERAFVFTGVYEKVFPFDIYPGHLVKSIIVNDIEQMENLGIYEVAPEDFALCEFVCPSKLPVQKIVREGLDTIYSETK